MPKAPAQPEFTRRERQIMDAIYRRGRATAAAVRGALPRPPSYSAVRALLAILVQKGRLKIVEDGPRYVYVPTRPRADAGRSALRRALDTFFAGSLEQAVAALLDARDGPLSPAERARLQSLIEQSSKPDGTP